MQSKAYVPSGIFGGAPESTAVARKIFFHLFSFGAGFCLAQSNAFENYSPFGLAFTAALPAEFTVMGAIGSAAGYLVSKTGNMPLRYLAALTVATAVSYAVKRMKKISMQGVLLGLCSLMALLLTGIAVSFAEGLTLSDVVMYGAESLMAGGCTYVFHACFSVLPRGSLSAAAQWEKVCIAASLSIVLMGFSGAAVFGFAPARVAAGLIILFAANLRREAGGAVMGACMGVSMALLPQQSFLAAAYPAAGLLAGAFAAGGRFAQAAAFALTSGVVSVAVRGETDIVATLVETAAATVIFVLIPENKIKALKTRLFPVKEEPPEGVRGALLMRLDVASAAMNDVSDCVEKVTENLQTMTAGDVSTVYSSVQSSVCRQCGLRSYCWDKNFNDTINVFNDMVYLLRDEGVLDREKLAPHFVKRCIRLSMLAETMRAEYEKFTASVTAGRSINRVRSIVSDQFCAVADMLSELSEEFSLAHRFDREAAVRVEAALGSNGIEARQVSCIVDPFGRMNIEAYCKKTDKKISAAALTQDVSAASGRQVLPSGVTLIGEEELITFTERAEYTVQMGAAQYSASEDEPCGDAYEYFGDGRGRQIMVISDGMGTGSRAAVDGAMAAGLLSKLIRAGFGFDSSLKIVNSALLVKSAEESFATLDIVCLDLFSGKADFLKAGAPATFVRCKGKASVTERASLPAGILRETEFARSTATLGQGDIILMVSDGVINGSWDWILSELELWHSGTAGELAEHIAKEAVRRRMEQRADDITVIAAIIDK